MLLMGIMRRRHVHTRIILVIDIKCTSTDLILCSSALFFRCKSLQCAWASRSVWYWWLYSFFGLLIFNTCDQKNVRHWLFLPRQPYVCITEEMIGIWSIFNFLCCTTWVRLQAKPSYRCWIFLGYLFFWKVTQNIFKWFFPILHFEENQYMSLLTGLLRSALWN